MTTASNTRERRALKCFSDVRMINDETKYDDALRLLHKIVSFVEEHESNWPMSVQPHLSTYRQYPASQWDMLSGPPSREREDKRSLGQRSMSTQRWRATGHHDRDVALIGSQKQGCPASSAEAHPWAEPVELARTPFRPTVQARGTGGAAPGAGGAAWGASGAGAAGGNGGAVDESSTAAAAPTGHPSCSNRPPPISPPTCRAPPTLRQ